MERLTTRYVGFADEDSWREPGSLSRAADIMDAHDDIGALTATILTHPDGDEDPIVQGLRASPLPDQPELPGHPLLSILAGASLLRVKAFRQVGGSEPRFEIGGEELLAADLAAAGWALRYLPCLTVHHAASGARDPHRRRSNVLRNNLWFNWLRRPLADAAWRSLRTLRAAPWDRVTARAVVEAAAGLPWVARERRILPSPVAEGLRSPPVPVVSGDHDRWLQGGRLLANEAGPRRPRPWRCRPGRSVRVSRGDAVSATAENPRCKRRPIRNRRVRP